MPDLTAKATLANQRTIEQPAANGNEAVAGSSNPTAARDPALKRTDDAEWGRIMNSNKEMRTRMESIGTYLPSTIITTRELVASISSRTAPPVEELTGVKERRVYNRTEADCVSEMDEHGLFLA